MSVCGEEREREREIRLETIAPNVTQFCYPHSWSEVTKGHILQIGPISARIYTCAMNFPLSPPHNTHLP